jgi:hypothetical protein
MHSPKMGMRFYVDLLSKSTLLNCDSHEKAEEKNEHFRFRPTKESQRKNEGSQFYLCTGLGT